ncbi:MAG: hypothetical protein BRC58_02920 [Cyanobacteria bacterium QS_8_64_29]|nr:MAG: hypothetical protein BRC58_02920 [Cyanobacteria bacterium QS_8_64_29]
MYDDEESTALDAEAEPESPLDELESVEAEGERSPPLDADAMLAQLTASEPPQRMIAARAFCELQDARAVPDLVRLLGDVCPLVRVSAAYALGRNPSPDAVESLIAQLGCDWSGYVRKGIVWALGNCSDRRSVEPLTHALKTDISAVRLWAASSLAQIARLGYEAIVAAVPALIEVLRQDAMAAVRSNCAWTLGQLCRELPANVVYSTAVDALLEALVEDSDVGVSEDAKAALLRLGDPRGLQTIEELEQEGLA